jgi:MFS family permease
MRSTKHCGKRPVRFPLLARRDFVRLWAAATVSSAGTQVSALAIPLTAILLLHAGAFQVGLLIASTYLPLALFGLPMGAFADRVRRRPLLITADLLRAAALATVPAAFLFHELRIEQLYAVGLVVGTFDVLFDVSHGSYLPSLVEPKLLVDANARLQLSEQGASTLGPAAASVLVTALGAPVAVAVNAASFALSALLLASIGHREREPAVSDAPRRILAEISEGLRYVARRPSLRALTATAGLTNLFLRMIQAVLLIRLARDAGLPPPLIGAVLSIGEAGFFIGALVAGRVRRRFGLGNTLAGSAAIISLSGLPIALAPNRLAAALTAAGLFVYGVAAVIWTINSSAYRQATTPSELLGRVGSVMRVAAWGTIPIASVTGGAIGSAIGAQGAMVVAAIGALIAPLPILVWRFRHGAPEGEALGAA